MNLNRAARRWPRGVSVDKVEKAVDGEWEVIVSDRFGRMELMSFMLIKSCEVEFRNYCCV